MVQKCSLLKVLEVFFIEPTTIHFIKEISKRIKLAPTSVRNYIKELLEDDLIKRKKAKPFNGFVGNRENDNFIFYKRVYNLYSLKELTDFLVSSYYPKLIAVYGSYSLGEDVENSDIDIFILTKTKKDVDLKEFEMKLNKKIHPLITKDLEKLDPKIRRKLWNGIVLYGGF
jgi:predicted nucleotidyltransferase